MNTKFRIDASGNILVGDDTASTTAKYLLLYIVAMAHADSNITVTYDENTVCSNVSFNRATGVLAWDEDGQTQTYSFDNTSALQAFLEQIHGDVETGSSDQGISIADLHDVRDAIIAHVDAQPAVDISGLATQESVNALASAVGVDTPAEGADPQSIHQKLDRANKQIKKQKKEFENTQQSQKKIESTQTILSGVSAAAGVIGLIKK